MEPTQAKDRSPVDYSLMPGMSYHFSGPGYILSVAETDDGIMALLSDSNKNLLSAIEFNVREDRWNFSPPPGVCATPEEIDTDISHQNLTIDSSQCQLCISQYSNKGPSLVIQDRHSSDEISRTWADLFTSVSSPEQRHRYWKGSDVASQRKLDGL